AEAAERLSMDRSSVANLVRLTELEPAIRELIGEGRLGQGHGKALLAVEAGPGRERLASEAAAGGWSVRRLEAAASAARSSGRAPADASGAGGDTPSRRSAVIASLERKLGDELGTKVRIKTNAGGTKGRLEIDFFGLEHFDGLVARLGVRDPRD
ncbi:MAG: chromosome partitioning protein ParB, partial [Planctomycetota bacterium]